MCIRPRNSKAYFRSGLYCLKEGCSKEWGATWGSETQLRIALNSLVWFGGPNHTITRHRMPVVCIVHVSTHVFFVLVLAYPTIIDEEHTIDITGCCG